MRIVLISGTASRNHPVSWYKLQDTVDTTLSVGTRFKIWWMRASNVAQ